MSSDLSGDEFEGPGLNSGSQNNLGKLKVHSIKFLENPDSPYHSAPEEMKKLF